MRAAVTAMAATLCLSGCGLLYDIGQQHARSAVSRDPQGLLGQRVNWQTQDNQVSLGDGLAQVRRCCIDHLGRRRPLEHGFAPVVANDSARYPALPRGQRD